MILRWDGAGLVECGDPGTEPEVVDSWLLRSGAVSNWRLHVARFGHPRFMEAVRDRLPAEGTWFPRVELHGGQLYLRVRPAPPLRAETVLWIPPVPDPREQPAVKGPDLGLLGELRDRARGFGADDAVLWTPDGLVAEGAHCTLAWWEDDRLMFPEHPRQLPSVTAQATRQRQPVGSRPVRLGELREFPVWAGNALHGWTPVTAWLGADGRPLR